MPYGLRTLAGAIGASLVAVVAYGILETGSSSQVPLSSHRNDQYRSTERIRCPTQPPVLDVGNDWVSSPLLDGRTALIIGCNG
jgi:hypothetical protein